MANTTKPLTNTEVKQNKPRKKEYNLADGNGLYLRVKPSGTKLWIFNYLRPFTKKRAKLGLGIFPDISLAEARVEAQKFKGLLAKEIDPKEYRIEQAWKEEGLNRSNSLHLEARRWLPLPPTILLTKPTPLTPAHSPALFSTHARPRLGPP